MMSRQIYRFTGTGTEVQAGALMGTIEQRLGALPGLEEQDVEAGELQPA